jgi:hypothetical protein
MNPARTLISYFFKISLISYHLSIGLPSGLFYLDFRTKIYAFLLSPICATCLAYQIALDSSTLIVFGQIEIMILLVLKCSQTSCYFLLLGIYILLSTLSSNTQSILPLTSSYYFLILMFSDKRQEDERL